MKKRMTTHNSSTRRRVLRRIGTAIAALVPVLGVAGAVHAATLTTASVTLSDPRPSTASVSYDFLASSISATSIQCIKEVYSINADGTGGVPTGFNSSTSAAVNTGASTIFASHASWSLNKTTNGTLLYTNATGAAPSVTTGAHFVVGGITNGSTTNTGYYLTFSTYTSSNCSTGPVDSVVVQYIFTDGQQVSIGVDPSLSFAVAGVTGNGSLTVNGATITNGLATTSSTIPFGTLTAASNKVAAQDLTVSTNAGNGYTVYVRYTGKPTVNSFNIDDLNTGTSTNASPTVFTGSGTEGFGYTTEDFTLGTGTPGRFSANKWASFTTSNAEVVYNATTAANQTTRVGFQAGIAGSTEPGAYTTTVIYTATPVY
jgi:hypothetical protein